MLRVLVPEVERPIRSGSAESSMDWVKGYSINGEYLVDIAIRRIRLAMAFEGEI
jgi:hypothetical protein